MFHPGRESVDVVWAAMSVKGKSLPFFVVAVVHLDPVREAGSTHSLGKSW